MSYEAAGQTTCLRFQAQRSGEVLVVSFAKEPENQVAVAAALRQSQLRELAALAEAEAEAQRLHQALLRMPAGIAVLAGPAHVYTLTNPEYEQLFPGRTIRQVVPAIEEQGFYELFDQVYQTGEPFYAPEAEMWADFSGTGQAEQRFYRTALEPIRDAQGQVVEVRHFTVDVTAQVATRQRPQALAEELTARNAELQATNADYQAANVALGEAQQQLSYLNEELEAHMRARTYETQVAYAAAEQQRARLVRL